MKAKEITKIMRKHPNAKVFVNEDCTEIQSVEVGEVVSESTEETAAGFHTEAKGPQEREAAIFIKTSDDEESRRVDI